MRTDREEANDNNAVVIKNLTKVCVEPFHIAIPGSTVEPL